MTVAELTKRKDTLQAELDQTRNHVGELRNKLSSALAGGKSTTTIEGDLMKYQTRQTALVAAIDDLGDDLEEARQVEAAEQTKIDQKRIDTLAKRITELEATTLERLQSIVNDHDDLVSEWAWANSACQKNKALTIAPVRESFGVVRQAAQQAQAVLNQRRYVDAWKKIKP